MTASPPISNMPADFAAEIRQRIIAERAAAKEYFLESPSGTAHARHLAEITDTTIKYIFANLVRKYPALAGIAIIATGGYGRGLLSPHSDIDLLFLHNGNVDKKTEQAIQDFLYCLWDAHLTIGHQVATTEQLCHSAIADSSIATALMEARLLAGEQKLFSELRQCLTEKVMAGRAAEYIEDKMEECRNRHARMGDSRFLLEPNVKEGKGGLRDLNTLWWIAKFARGLDKEDDLLRRGILLEDEYSSYTNATDFLLLTRAWMHYITGRTENMLTFDLQREISSHYGDKNISANEAVEHYMKNYFNWARKVGELNRTICGILASEHGSEIPIIMPTFLNMSQLGEIEGFPVENQMLSLANPADILANPALILKIFRTSQKHKVEIHPRLLRFFSANLDCIDNNVRASSEANEIFIDILLGSSPQTRTLRRMNDCGVLGQFLPDFQNIVGQMQFDLYHTYTVDEHTLNAIGNLAGLARGNFSELMPIASKLINDISLKKALYVGLLLHDVAKGCGGGHSEHGADIVLRIAPRLGLDGRESETAAWLVANHLLLTQIAFKRDLSDPVVIKSLASKVQSLERLNLLLLLTVADINAVGPKIWNGWKGALLRRLYMQTAAIMGGHLPEEENAANIERLKKTLALEIPDISYLDFDMASCWLGFSSSEHTAIARLFADTRSSGHASFDISPHQFHDATELKLCAPAQSAILARLSWASAASGFSIVSARCFTHPSGISIAALEFQGFDGKAVLDEKRLKKLRENLTAVTGLNAAMPETKIVQPRKSARLEAVTINASVDIYNNVSATNTVIEITARDRLGLLYDISRKCSELGLEVHTAHISTYGVQAVDVFYVQDIFGQKITQPERLELIKSSIMQVLGVKQKATIR